MKRLLIALALAGCKKHEAAPPPAPPPAPVVGVDAAPPPDAPLDAAAIEYPAPMRTDEWREEDPACLFSYAWGALPFLITCGPDAYHVVGDDLATPIDIGGAGVGKYYLRIHHLGPDTLGLGVGYYDDDENNLGEVWVLTAKGTTVTAKKLDGADYEAAESWVFSKP